MKTSNASLPNEPVLRRQPASDGEDLLAGSCGRRRCCPGLLSRPGTLTSEDSARHLAMAVSTDECREHPAQGEAGAQLGLEVTWVVHPCVVLAVILAKFADWTTPPLPHTLEGRSPSTLQIAAVM